MLAPSEGSEEFTANIDDPNGRFTFEDALESRPYFSCCHSLINVH